MNTNIVPIDHALRGQLEHRLVKHGMDSVTANAAINDMLGYLHTIAHNPGCGFGPSEIVDMAWHEFILHTADYFAYCEMAFGHYVHHRPNRQGEVGKLVSETAKFMSANGIVFDPKLWGECDNNCSPPTEACRPERFGDPILVNVIGNVRSDCDDGRGGGPSGCAGDGSPQCS